MRNQTRYPSYDVMKEKDQWDDHTQRIVVSRLKAPGQPKFLTNREVETIRHIGARLTGDDRKELLEFIWSHIDQTLSRQKGEGQRKDGVPPEKELVRKGLDILDLAANRRYGNDFVRLDEKRQIELLTDFSQYQATETDWPPLLQRAWFNKLLNLTLEAYYSHPTIWSEIGYGGPAYPRGYVRTQTGQLDPWEAQPER